MVTNRSSLVSFPSNKIYDHLPRGSDPVDLILEVVFPKTTIAVPPGLKSDLHWVVLVLQMLLASLSAFFMDLKSACRMGNFETFRLFSEYPCMSISCSWVCFRMSSKIGPGLMPLWLMVEIRIEPSGFGVGCPPKNRLRSVWSI